MAEKNKRQRIEEAREAARQARLQREKRKRLLAWLVPVLSSVVVIAIVVVIVVVVANQPKQTVATGVAPKNMATYGIQFTGSGGKIRALETGSRGSSEPPLASTVAKESGKIHIVEYLDLSCPTCKYFESQTLDYVTSLVAAGKATLQLQPIAILDRSYGGTNYSTRVNTAGACVANSDPQDYLAFAKEAYANQPDEETSDGLTNAQIVTLAKDAGVTSSRVSSCITNQTYSSWVDSVTSYAGDNDAVDGTPTVVVDGKTLNLQAFTLTELKGLLPSA